MSSKTAASHKASQSTRILNGGGERNSSIELLRIVAMFMILASHFVVHNGYDVKDLPSRADENLFPACYAKWRRGGRCHLLHYLRVVLP